jgi:hypothetical protein
MADPDPEAPEPLAEPAEPDAVGEFEPDDVAVAPGAPEPGLPPEVDDMPPDPEEPDVEPAPPPGTMAGEPEVVEPEPEAAGRSAEGVDKGDVD